MTYYMKEEFNDNNSKDVRKNIKDLLSADRRQSKWSKQIG